MIFQIKTTLLGDIENSLNNNENKKIEIILPFYFLGQDNIYISLLYDVGSQKDSYIANIEKIKVFHFKENTENLIFSFSYDKDVKKENQKADKEFQQMLEAYNKREAEYYNENNIDPTIDHFPSYDEEEPERIIYEFKIKVEINKKYVLKNLLDLIVEYGNLKNEFNKLELALKKARGLLERFTAITGNSSDLIKMRLDIEQKLNSNVEYHYDEFLFSNKELCEVYEHTTKEEIFFETICHAITKAFKPFVNENKKKNVIEQHFKDTWSRLISNLKSINYLSSLDEANKRIYDTSSNTLFIKLLKNFASVYHDFDVQEFTDFYLKKFNIGKEIIVKEHPKFQIITVKIKTAEGIERDLVDFGYGIKQLTILLIQISVLIPKEEQRENNQSILIVEEPETNLHPKWQSVLGEMFVEASNKFNIQFIIETHSEYLIRKLQTLVAKNEIKGEKVKIFYLRNPQNLGENKKQVESFCIQDDGAINYEAFDGGFFDESYKLEQGLLNINFSKEFEEIKRQNLDDEEKINQLQLQIDRDYERTNIETYKIQIEEKFNTTKLQSKSVEYLASGQFLLNTIDENSDFSPVIIQYGRTIENELTRIIHKKFGKKGVIS